MVIQDGMAVIYRDTVLFKKVLSFLLTSFSPLHRNIFSNPVLKLAPFPSLGLSLRLLSKRRLLEWACSKWTSIPPTAQLGFLLLSWCLPSLAYCISMVSLMWFYSIVGCISTERLQDGEELGNHHQELSMNTHNTVWHIPAMCSNIRMSKSCFVRLLRLINLGKTILTWLNLTLYITLRKFWPLGQWDAPVSNGACQQAWHYEFNPQNQHDGRR